MYLNTNYHFCIYLYSMAIEYECMLLQNLIMSGLILWHNVCSKASSETTELMMCKNKWKIMYNNNIS